MENPRPGLEDTGSAYILLKRPQESEKTTRGPFAHFRFTLSLSKSIFWFGMGENTFPLIYNFATEIELVIKYSF